MGRIITRDIRDKLIPLIRSDDEFNWTLALQLLRGLEGLSNDGAEEWFYLAFRDHWKDKRFSVRNRAATFLLENMNKPHRMKMKVVNWYQYMINSMLFVNSMYGAIGGTTTSIKFSQVKGNTKIINNNYRWELGK